MRNGNPQKLYFCQSIFFQFLPYLWGMETRKGVNMNEYYCVLTVPMRNGNSNLQDLKKLRDGSSYRTYEEWKQRLAKWWRWRLIWFLPYLWGMETEQIHDKSEQQHVLTVPMRNGNLLVDFGEICQGIFVLTVPMRNGNPFRSGT